MKQLAFVLLVACAPLPPDPAPIAPTPVAPAAKDPETPKEPETPAIPPNVAVAKETQRTGDAAQGRDLLLNGNYVRCGLPWALYQQFSTALPGGEAIPGRKGKNASLPYQLTAVTTASGVEVVAPNCLACHAGYINGALVIGLGNASADFTNDNSGGLSLVEGFLQSETEKVELRKFAARMQTVGPYTKATTIGVNPADNLAAILFAHRDPKTLAWSDEPLLDPPPKTFVPVDVPPWWRMAKKNAMFYSAAGRGDHARIMMTASALCTDTAAEAAEIDAFFHHVRSFITNIEPPAWPYDIDSELAQKGEVVFNATCAECHGRYGVGTDYPNVVVPLEVINTDAALAKGSQFAERFIEWYGKSFYGETSRFEPQEGYLAPPLDGVWSTAPFLHNGSVPTIAALLDSKQRPKFWTREFEDSSAYDEAAVGWKHTALTKGKSGEPDATKKKRVYDTTLAGHSNGGHTFGDALSDSDRRAVLEYLKTL